MDNGDNYKLLVFTNLTLWKFDKCSIAKCNFESNFSWAYFLLFNVVSNQNLSETFRNLYWKESHSIIILLTSRLMCVAPAMYWTVQVRKIIPGGVHLSQQLVPCWIACAVFSATTTKRRHSTRGKKDVNFECPALKFTDGGAWWYKMELNFVNAYKKWRTRAKLFRGGNKKKVTIKRA